MQAKIQKEFNMDISLRDIFANPTIIDLSKIIENDNFAGNEAA